MHVWTPVETEAKDKCTVQKNVIKNKKKETGVVRGGVGWIWRETLKRDSKERIWKEMLKRESKKKNLKRKKNEERI